MATPAPKVKVYYGKPMLPDVSRVLACLKEKDVKFELIDMYEGKHMTRDLIKFQASRAAVSGFEDGSTRLFESRAICRHIVDKYADRGNKYLMGRDLLERASIEQWLKLEEHSFDPPSWALIFHLAFNVEPDRALITESERMLSNVLDVYEQRLADSKFLAGDEFSLADLTHLPNSHYLASSKEWGHLFESRKNVSKWWGEISNRHSWQKVVEILNKVGLLEQVKVTSNGEYQFTAEQTTQAATGAQPSQTKSEEARSTESPTPGVPSIQKREENSQQTSQGNSSSKMTDMQGPTDAKPSTQLGHVDAMPPQEKEQQAKVTGQEDNASKPKSEPLTTDSKSSVTPPISGAQPGQKKEQNESNPETTKRDPRDIQSPNQQGPPGTISMKKQNQDAEPTGQADNKKEQDNKPPTPSLDAQSSPKPPTPGDQLSRKKEQDNKQTSHESSSTPKNDGEGPEKKAQGPPSTEGKSSHSPKSTDSTSGTDTTGASKTQSGSPSFDAQSFPKPPTPGDQLSQKKEQDISSTPKNDGEGPEKAQGPPSTEAKQGSSSFDARSFPKPPTPGDQLSQKKEQDIPSTPKNDGEGPEKAQGLPSTEAKSSDSPKSTNSTSGTDTTDESKNQSGSSSFDAQSSPKPPTPGDQLIQKKEQDISSAPKNDGEGPEKAQGLLSTEGKSSDSPKSTDSTSGTETKGVPNNQSGSST